MSNKPIQGRLSRSARLGRVAAGAGARLISGNGKSDNFVKTVDSLVDQLSQMRGAAMKLGQALSTLEFPGLDPDQADYVRARLASLRDDVPPVSWPEMERVLLEEWQGEMLIEVEEEAAAAASIGQVHRGRDQEGRRVAVKIQYPGVAEAVEADMRNLKLLSPLLKQLLPGVEIKDLLAELRERVAEECDYELEAQNHRQIYRHFRNHPFIYVPRVDRSLSTRRVLVTDWVDGDDFAAVCQRDEAARDRYCEIIFRFFYSTAGEVGLALGDPHPGNYLLCPDGRVAFFDFGMVRRLTANYLADEAGVLTALKEESAADLVAAMSRLGYRAEELDKAEGQLLLAQMRRLSWWILAEEPIRLDSEKAWRATKEIQDRSSDEFRVMASLRLPPEALLLRRMEGLIFQTAVALEAKADWGALYDELVAGNDPKTDLGREHKVWRRLTSR